MRSYNQFCGVARALDLVGERWALLVVRELVLGPKRFKELREGLPGIATNVLTQRLRQLEEAGVVSRRVLPPPAASAIYELTDNGRELVPILLSLGRWGAASLGTRSPAESLRPEWVAVALMAFFDPVAAGDLTATIRLDLGEAQFTARVEDGRLEVLHGPNGAADLIVAAQPEMLIASLAGAPVPLEAEGDQALLERLPALFPFGAA